MKKGSILNVRKTNVNQHTKEMKLKKSLYASIDFKYIANIMFIYL